MVIIPIPNISSIVRRALCLRYISAMFIARDTRYPMSVQLYQYSHSKSILSLDIAYRARLISHWCAGVIRLLSAYFITEEEDVRQYRRVSWQIFRHNWCAMRLVGWLFCLFLVFAGSNAGGPILVLLDNLAIKETHSIFFKMLQGIRTLLFLIISDVRIIGSCL